MKKFWCVLPLAFMSGLTRASAAQDAVCVSMTFVDLLDKHWMTVSWFGILVCIAMIMWSGHGMPLAGYRKTTIINKSSDND